ncbi:MAG: chalcone isomerase family protein [Pseudomonadota bacterium]
MKKLLQLFVVSVLFTLLAIPSISFSKEVEGVNIPDDLLVDGSNLVLNGAGTRSKFFIDVYIGGLYLKSKNKNADQIITADEPMAITLHITSGMLTTEKMETALREGFEKSTQGKQDAIKSEIEQIINAFKEEISEDDKFQIVYVPGQGVKVSKNGEFKTLIPGLNFKSALFGIWLGKEPADDDLKEDMLGN